MIIVMSACASLLAAAVCGRMGGRAVRPGARAPADYAAVGLYLLAGLLALGVGARSWPGLYLPGSRWLSGLVGDCRLFAGAFALAFVAAACAAARIAMRVGPPRPRLAAVLGVLQAAAVAWCGLVGVLGVLGAVLVWRLSE
jgi:hypothetical protein